MDKKSGPVVKPTESNSVDVDDQRPRQLETCSSPIKLWDSCLFLVSLVRMSTQGGLSALCLEEVDLLS